MSGNMLLEAVRHFCSIVMDAGSRGTTAHAHQCSCRFQGYPKAVPSRMKLTMREPASMTTGKGSRRVTSYSNSVYVLLEQQTKIIAEDMDLMLSPVEMKSYNFRWRRKWFVDNFCSTSCKTSSRYRNCQFTNLTSYWIIYHIFFLFSPQHQSRRLGVHLLPRDTGELHGVQPWFHLVLPTHRVTSGTRAENQGTVKQ